MSTTTARQRRGEVALLGLRLTLIACVAGFAGAIGVTAWRLLVG